MPLGWSTPVVCPSWSLASAKPADHTLSSINIFQTWPSTLIHIRSSTVSEWLNVSSAVVLNPPKPIKKSRLPNNFTKHYKKKKKYLKRKKKHLFCLIVSLCSYCILISGGPLSALTCCVNARLLSAIKKISPLIYSQSWVGSWVYTTQAMMTFTLIF